MTGKLEPAETLNPHVHLLNAVLAPLHYYMKLMDEDKAHGCNGTDIPSPQLPILVFPIWPVGSSLASRLLYPFYGFRLGR
jgi:hypothetical protein